MRFLADENFLGVAVEALRQQGHDVVWIRTHAPGSSDVDVLAMAEAENRILLTFDRDFGELAFRAGLPAICGIVLFRLRMTTPTQVVQRIIATLASRTDWAGHFSVVEEGRVRMRPLPGLAL
jgi:predicted nuclease of predicted toxin-antitoxin system